MALGSMATANHGCQLCRGKRLVESAVTATNGIRTVRQGLLEPSAFAGWDAMTDEQLSSSLVPAVATVEATRTVLQTQVDLLRQRGISWNAIGGVLGMSRQAA
jgi:hypothetical protein